MKMTAMTTNRMNSTGIYQRVKAYPHSGQVEALPAIIRRHEGHCMAGWSFLEEYVRMRVRVERRIRTVRGVGERNLSRPSGSGG